MDAENQLDRHGRQSDPGDRSAVGSGVGRRVAQGREVDPDQDEHVVGRIARLNRSGDRQANSALWHIVITRMVYDPRTTEYIARRIKEGLTKKEAVRCLKRYIAREVYTLLPHERLGLDSP